MARLWTLLLLVWIAVPAAAQTFPELTGRIVDQAGLLPPNEEAELVQRLEDHEARTGHQFVIATVSGLEGYPIEDYGYRLGRHWGIGRAGADDGVLLLVAPNEREVRIEVGYRLEPWLTDAASKQIIEHSILPSFREGDMAGGIVWGAGSILSRLSLTPEEAQRLNAEAAAEAREWETGEMVILGFGAFMFFVFLPFGIVMMIWPRKPVQQWGPPRPAPAPAPVVAPDAWAIDGADGGGWAGVRYKLRLAWRSLGESGGERSWSSSGSSSWSSSSSSSSSSFSGGGGSFGGGGASGRW